jgi:hypothetical protein
MRSLQVHTDNTASLCLHSTTLTPLTDQVILGRDVRWLRSSIRRHVQGAAAVVKQPEVAGAGALDQVEHCRQGCDSGSTVILIGFKSASGKQGKVEHCRQRACMQV